jgi:hypothetical protein
MNEFERRLERTLLTRAETVVAGQRLSGDSVVAAGRTAHRRRRQGIGAAVVAGALAVVVGAGVLAQTRSVGTGPVPPGSPPPASPTTEDVPVSPPGVAPVTALGLDVAGVAGHRILGPNGEPFTVPLPDGQTIDAVVHVPGGWVIQSNLDSSGPDAGFYLWFRDTTGQLTGMGRVWGGFEVSPDGRRVVNAGPDEIVAYEVPSLRVIDRTTPSSVGSVVHGIVGDWVVLKDVAGDGTPMRAYTWNLRTGQVRGTDADVNIWGVTDDGRVLRRVLQNADRGCVDLVPVADLPTVRDTGLCSEQFSLWNAGGASLSPDGTWALVSVNAEPSQVWVRVADLRAGRWRPVPADLPESGSVKFWYSDDALIFWADSWEYYHCRPTEPCFRLAVPVLPEGTVIVRRRGLT